MERPSIENPEEYVKKQIKKYEKLEDLEYPIAILKEIVDYKFQESETLETTIDGLHLKISYKMIEIPTKIDEDVVRKKVIDNSLTKNERYSHFVNMMVDRADDPNDLREITDFFVSTDSVSFDLKKELPEVKLLMTTELCGPGANIVDTKINVIALGNETIFRPKTFITLLHEIGHILTVEEILKTGTRQEHMKMLSINDEKELLDTAIYATYLELERAAWTYAIKRIIPFLDNLGIQLADVMTFKDRCIASHVCGLDLKIDDDERIVRVPWNRR